MDVPMGKNENHKQKTFDDANLTCYFTDPRSINLSFRILFHLCFTKLGISKPESITKGEIPSRASSRIHAKLKLRPLHTSLGRHGDFAKRLLQSWGKCCENGEQIWQNQQEEWVIDVIWYIIWILLWGYLMRWRTAIPSKNFWHMI